MSEKIDPMANSEVEEPRKDEETSQLKGLALTYQDNNWSIVQLDDYESLTEEELYSFCWQFVGSFLAKLK